MRNTFLTFTWGKLCKKPEVDSEPTHFLTFMNNGSFPSLDYMAWSQQCPDQPQLLTGHWQAKSYWIS